MFFFGCRGCRAREQEIDHLRAELRAQREQTDRLAAQMCEIVSPGSSRRAVPPPKVPATAPKVERAQVGVGKVRYNFPGYERLESAPTPPEIT